MPSEMKEYCISLQSFQVKVNVRLKAESTKIEGKVAGTSNNHFLLQTDSQETPLRLRYLNVANIGSV